MGQKLKIEGKDYSIDNITETASANLAALKFASSKIEELNNLIAVLRRAKKSYIRSLKKEVVSSKAGLNL